MWSYISNQVSNVLVEKESRGIQTESTDTDRLLRTYKYDMAQLQSKFKALEISHKKSIHINDELISELNLYKSKIDEKRVSELSKKDFISLERVEKRVSGRLRVVDISVLERLCYASDKLFPLSKRSEQLRDLLFKEYEPNFTLAEYKGRILNQSEDKMYSLSKDVLVQSLFATSVAADNFKNLFYKAIEKKTIWPELESSVIHTHHVFSSGNDLKLANIELRRENKSKTLALDRANNEILNLKNELKQYKNTSKILKTK